MNTRTPLNDAEAHAFYADPANQYVADDAGPPIVGQPKGGRPLPVRFDEDSIATIRRLARADGVSVSVWIRRAVSAQIAAAGAKPSIIGPSRTLEVGEVVSIVERLEVDVEALKQVFVSAKKTPVS